MLSQPQSTNLPSDIQAAVDAARANIAANEIELRNIQKAKTAEQYTVSELLKQKAELEEQIASDKEIAEQLDVKIQELTTSYNALVEKNKEEEVRLTDKLNELSAKEQELIEESARLATENANLSDKTAVFNGMKDEYTSKSSKLDEFLSKLEAVIKER